jgi:hyperosmotically inducible periplasmic protein
MDSVKDFLIINLIGTCLFLLNTSNVLADNQPTSHRFIVQSSQSDEITPMHCAEIQIRAILATNPVLGRYNIKAYVSNNRAHLTGQVRNEDERQLAESIAKSIPDINEVKNNITVNKNFKPGASPSWSSAIIDASITAMIKSSYLLTPIINARNIHVTTANGVATLTGNVKSEEEKEDAENMAIHIPGVITVKNHLLLKKI